MCKKDGKTMFPDLSAFRKHGLRNNVSMFVYFQETWLGNNMLTGLFAFKKQARNQCFLVRPPSGNMARKQYFLVRLPLGNKARKQSFLVCLSSGNMVRKQCLLVCSPSGNMARKQCSTVIQSSFVKHGRELYPGQLS